MLDKCKSNHTGDGKIDGKTRTEVHTGKIYELILSNSVTRGVTERWTLIIHVSWNAVHEWHGSLLIHSNTYLYVGYPQYEPTYL